MDWHTEGFWAVYDHPATALQFLTLDQGYRPIDGTPPLNLIQEVAGAQFPQSEVYYCRDIDSGQLNKAITLEAFKQMDIDIVIASIPAHVERFKRLIATYKPNAKLIFQIGNAWTVEAAQAPNIMASAVIRDVPPDVNFIEYHQEFDLKKFYPQPKTPDPEIRKIYSFVNVFEHFPDWPLFTELEMRAPANWEWRSFGGQCRDGAIGPAAVLADKMREADFIFHVKAGGDGYGHVLHNAAAVGRPLIVKRSYYHNTLGERLLIPNETCIDIDGMSHHEILAAIEYWSQSANYAAMHENIMRNFRKNVDFDTEFIKIQEFLGNLK